MRQLTPHSVWIGHVGDARDARGVLAAGIRAVVDLAANEPPTANWAPAAQGVGNCRKASRPGFPAARGPARPRGSPAPPNPAPPPPSLARLERLAPPLDQATLAQEPPTLAPAAQGPPDLTG